MGCHVPLFEAHKSLTCESMCPSTENPIEPEGSDVHSYGHLTVGDWSVVSEALVVTSIVCDDLTTFALDPEESASLLMAWSDTVFYGGYRGPTIGRLSWSRVEDRAVVCSVEPVLNVLGEFGVTKFEVSQCGPLCVGLLYV